MSQEQNNNDKKKLINSKELINQADYQYLLQDLKTIIANGQSRAYKAANNIISGRSGKKADRLFGKK